MTKTERQELATQHWRSSYGKGALVHPTGFGKTREGVMVLKRVLDTQPNSKVIITVPSQPIMKNWDKELQTVGLDKDERIDIYTFDSVITNDVKASCDLLIVDEIHKTVSTSSRLRVNIINKVHFQYKWILGLTATYPTRREEKGVLQRFCPIIDKISDKEAIENNWISKYLEYNLGLELPEKDRELYDKRSAYIKETLDLFKGVHQALLELNGFGVPFKDDYDVLQSCYSGKRHRCYGNWEFVTPEIIRINVAHCKGWSMNIDTTIDYYTEIDRLYSPKNIYERARAFNDIVRERNDSLNDHTVKLELIMTILAKFNGYKTICFSESTSFADRIARKYNQDFNTDTAVSYHSQIESGYLTDETGTYITYKTGVKKGQPKVFGKDYFKKVAIEGIKSGLYNVISTAKALDEGVDIVDLQLAILSSGTCNNIQQVQRGGRVKRLDFDNPNGVVYIINLYFRNTRDEQKLKQRQKESYNVIWVEGLEDIPLQVEI